MNKMIYKSLSAGIVLMGVIHIIATFTSRIANLLAPLSEGAQNSFTYMSLMCGALLVLGGTLVFMLAEKLSNHPFLLTPFLHILMILAIDGILAVIFMPHNPFAWIIFCLTVSLFFYHMIAKR